MVKSEILSKYKSLFPSYDHGIIFPLLDELATSFGFLNTDDFVKTEQGSLFSLLLSLDSMKNPDSPYLSGRMKQHDYGESLAKTSLPTSGLDELVIREQLIDLADGHPIQTRKYMTNAIPPPTKISLFAHQLGAKLNSNPVWDLYGPAAAKAEMLATKMMTDIMGYDSNEAGGYFTYGGTGGNAAALRIGIEKCCLNARKQGIYGKRVYVLSNELAHFSIDSVVSDSGIGSDNNIQIKSNPDNSMDLNDLERNIEKIYSSGGEIAAIYATVGTTDGFGLDEVSKIKEIKDRVSKKYNKEYSPHLHADLAMGGFFAFFKDYDFNDNPLKIEPKALEKIKYISERLSQVKDADSFVIDFHKLGYTPYINTFFGVKKAFNKKKDEIKSNPFDLDLVNRGQTPYIYSKNGGSNYMEFGSYHTSWTTECSRPSASLPAYANLMALGVEGYQALLANSIERAEQLKEKLNGIKGVEALNYAGPVVAFRFYEGENTWEKEVTGNSNSSEINNTNLYNRNIIAEFEKQKSEFYLGDTTRFRMLKSSEGELIAANAAKAFMISPFTDSNTIDELVDFVKNVKLNYDSCNSLVNKK
jgi:L-2,4-diaminobutyrate decarboxylase